MGEPFPVINRENIRELPHSWRAWLTTNLYLTSISKKLSPDCGRANQGINREISA